jgi:peptidoglycan/xylan/chitin deacetylase (PgdA/CDA1 family)
MIYNIPRLSRSLRQCTLAAILATALFGGAATAGDSASIIIYHRFGEDRHPATNIRLEQLDAHIEELTSGKYAVLPLEEIVAAIVNGRPLPDRAVAITIDDAFRSVYTEGWPRLRDAGLPFTLFVATEPVDSKLPDYMTWDQVREMRDAGVTIGAHSHTHLHMVSASLDTDRADIETSNRLFKRELGSIPNLFAYPYGEASLAVMDLVRTSGYEIAFGQHSGAANPNLPRFYLPRFPMNEAHGSLDRLRLALNALPLPVSQMTPADPLVPADGNPPPVGFTLAESLGKTARLACYYSHGKVQMERIGPHRVEVRFDTPFPTGRSRVNCTLPGPQGRWYWYGTQFYVKRR